MRALSKNRRPSLYSCSIRIHHYGYKIIYSPFYDESQREDRYSIVKIDPTVNQHHIRYSYLLKNSDEKLYNRVIGLIIKDKLTEKQVVDFYIKLSTVLGVLL